MSDKQKVSGKEFAQSVLKTLSKDFNIYTQVKGQHFSGKHLYLDAIVTPIAAQLWKNPNIALGIEFKNNLRLMGNTTNYTKWLAQCVDYAHTQWEGFGYIYIFTCPSLIAGIPMVGHDESTRWLLPRIMAHLGIGELKQDERYGLTFFLQEAHRIWSEQNGLESGRIWSIERKFGAR